MSWNFMLLIFINVCQVRWIVIVFRINYVHSPDEDFSAGVSGIIKTMHTGLARTRIALCQRPGADTEETGRYDLAWKICVVFYQILSVNSNELSKYSNIFYVHGCCNPSENSCFSKIFPVLLKCDFYSWFQPIIGRFYKMRVSWEFNIYNLLSLLLTRCYRFLTRCR